MPIPFLAASVATFTTILVSTSPTGGRTLRTKFLKRVAVSSVRGVSAEPPEREALESSLQLSFCASGCFEHSSDLDGLRVSSVRCVPLRIAKGMKTSPRNPYTRKSAYACGHRGVSSMRMGWFLIVILGCLVWAYLSVTMYRRNSNEFDRRARKAKKFRSRLLHPTFKG